MSAPRGSARPPLAATEEAILGKLELFFEAMISNPATGDASEDRWKQYVRLRKFYFVLIGQWNFHRCWLQPQVIETMKKIEWQTKMLDLINPITPVDATASPES